MNRVRGLERIAFLGNYVPRQCGIATFTQDLYRSVAEAAPDADCYVGAVTDQAAGYDYPEEVRFQFRDRDLPAYRRAADLLNLHNAEVLCVQHEFGIYGGKAGSYLLSLLREVRMPVVTTLHTVLEKPNSEQALVMQGLIRISARLVVMAQKGREILRDVYAVPDSKIDIIAHGIVDGEFSDGQAQKAQFGVSGRQVLLTFGLIGPSKGIEQAIEALPTIIERHPNVVYLVLGATHPHLVASEGEAYRHKLIKLAEKNGVKEHVIFHNRFVSKAELKAFIAAADIYLTPYLDREQITSGTLAYAFGSGKAVVSTPYWHAQELLAEGRGLLVPFGDPPAIARAVCDLLGDPARMQAMQTEAYQLGRDMIWPAIGQKYLRVFAHACADHAIPPSTAFADWTLEKRSDLLPGRKLDHILRMTDGTGIFQHATFNVPNFHEGYCVDDNARAFLLGVLLADQEHFPDEPNLSKCITVYLAFLSAALDRGTGRFRNFMSHSREWLESAGSEDSHGRSLWATGLGAAQAPNEGFRRLSAQLFERGLSAVSTFTSPRAWAFAILGLDAFLKVRPDHGVALCLYQQLSARLTELWQAHSEESWPWFERSVTYENARLCQAMILSGVRMEDPRALKIGLSGLRWLASIQLAPNGCFRPIGSNGFYPRDGQCAVFDQQPVEAQAMVAACYLAHQVTAEPFWKMEAKRAFEWFLGHNDLGASLYDFNSGACGDGLHEDRINENQGAESTLAFHLALTDMRDAEAGSFLSSKAQ